MSKPATTLVLGAAGTLGAACAQWFEARGDDLVLADVRAESLAAVLPTAPPKRVLRIGADLSVGARVEEVFAQGLARFRRADYAILATGVEGPIGPLEDASEDAFEQVVRANLKTVWLGLKHGLPLMKTAGRGGIVALASVSGLRGAPMLALYGATKHAVVGLVKAAAIEAGPCGVQVNCVCPGPVDSPMQARIDANLRPSGNASQALPLRRYATPRDVAELVGFLCSPAGRYCSGGAYTVDGGWTAR